MMPRHFRPESSPLTTLTVCAMLVAVLVFAGCGGTRVGARAVEKYNQNPLTVNVPPNLSPQAVEDIMVLTLRRRQWTVAQQSPQEVVGTLNHRYFQAKVILKVEDNLIKLYNDSYYQQQEGGETEPGVPLGWLRNLQSDLRTRLAVRGGGHL